MNGQKFLTSYILILSLIGNSGCSPVNFQKAADTSSTANAKNDVPIPDPTPGPTPAPVCNPFGGGSGSAGHGLAAEALFYRSATQSTSLFSSWSGVSTNGNVLNNEICMNDVNVPNRYFVDGFADATGKTLTAPDGSIVTEYFGFEAKASFVLGDWAGNGVQDYQIATLTDDGSILTISNAVLQNNGSTKDLVINNDGVHSLKMGCSSDVLHITSQSNPMPLDFKYFQGPKTTIGLIILARPVPPGNALDPLCGAGGGDDKFFFDDTVSPTKPTSNYQALVNRGWVPISNSHYILPPNTCSCAQ